MKRHQELMSLQEVKEDYGISIPNLVRSIKRGKLEHIRKTSYNSTAHFFVDRENLENFLKEYPNGFTEELVENTENTEKVNNKISRMSKNSKKVRDILYDKRISNLLGSDLF